MMKRFISFGVCLILLNLGMIPLITSTAATVPIRAPTPTPIPTDTDSTPSPDPNTQSFKKRFSRQTPTFLTAKTVTYAQDDDIVKAQGDVMVTQQDRRLRADTLLYYRRWDTLVALGNVCLEEPSGDVIFVDYMELTDDLKQGFAQEARMILSDDSKLAATRIERHQGLKNIFERVVYSPCKLCSVTPLKPPLWQIKARHVLWDQQKQEVEYTHAFLEFMGVPVFYSPYLKHPDPTVKRKTGFLSPSLGGSSHMGANLSIPYFIAIKEDKDLTLTPIVGTRSQILMGQYRQRFSKGFIEVEGSGGHVNKKQTSTESTEHWHANISGAYHATPQWRWGGQVLRTSDRAYVKKNSRLGFENASVLTSKVFGEGFYDLSYVTIHGVSFQGLRPEDRQATIPHVVPSLTVSYKSHPSWAQSWWTGDLNTHVLSREKGARSQRLSTQGGWHLPYRSPWGDCYQVDGIFRVDAYHVEGLRPIGSQDTVHAFQGRLFPQGAVRWWYPLIHRALGPRFMITPQANFVVAPRLGLHPKIPNEDSRIFELSDGNIMRNQRSSGIDQIEGGTRFTYGIALDSFFKSLGNSHVFIGQSYGLTHPRSDFLGTGIRKGFSDYVVRARIFPLETVKFSYRSRLDRKTLYAYRHEIGLEAGPSIFQGKMALISVAKPENIWIQEQGGRQITLGLTSDFVKHWTGSLGMIRELGGHGGTLSQWAGLRYQDECFIFDTTLSKTFYRDKDIKPGVTFLFTLEFKNLGSISQNFSVGGVSNQNNPLETS